MSVWENWPDISRELDDYAREAEWEAEPDYDELMERDDCEVLEEDYEEVDPDAEYERARAERLFGL